MKNIKVNIAEVELDYDTACGIAQVLAEKAGGATMLVSWCDRKQGKHSPAAVHCEINGRPGWEAYGENHGGRVKIIINEREYVFIYA